MPPVWLLDSVAALMLAVAAVSAARLAVAPPWRRRSPGTDTDVAHLLMALAMAGTLAPRLAILPGTAWEVVCGLLTAWFGYRAIQDGRARGVRTLATGHRAPHLAHSAAMLYMFAALAVPVAGATAGMARMGDPLDPAMRSLHYATLALVFAFVLVGYSIWDLDQLSGGRPGATTAGCRVAMGVSMAFMLLVMI
jgi:Domain of unknown function (DUF5134)